MDPKAERYFLSEAAEAASLPLATIRNWVARGHIAFGKSDTPSGIPGVAHQLGFNTVVRLAIVARLTQVPFGVAPELAWRFAGAFSESGSGGSGWVGDSNLNPGSLRVPGNLFDEGGTYLLIRNQSERAQVVNITGEMTWSQIVNLNMVGDFLCVEIDELYFNVHAHLAEVLRRRRPRAASDVRATDAQEA